MDVKSSPSSMREMWKKSGYSIEFHKKDQSLKTPVLAISRSDQAFWISVYNPSNTTQSRLSFPLGAPMMIGMDAEISGQVSSYYFSRSEHRECRIFVKQESGIVNCEEVAPVSGKWRRAIRVSGLVDATISFLPEAYCTEDCAVNKNHFSDPTPVYDDPFRLVHDKQLGFSYYRGEHISGSRIFLMPFLSDSE